MYTMAETVRGTTNTLDTKDYAATACCVENISVTENSTDCMTDRELLKEMQRMFTDDKGWSSEEEMLADMVEFRRKGAK